MTLLFVNVVAPRQWRGWNSAFSVRNGLLKAPKETDLSDTPYASDRSGYIYFDGTCSPISASATASLEGT